MRKIGFVAALGLCNLAGICNNIPPDHELRAGLTKEEMEAGPGYHQKKAAIIHDVRKGRMLQYKLEEGRPTCTGIVYTNGFPTCATEKADLEVYVLRSDPRDQPYRVDESAYFCPDESVYYYHYVGGPKRLDVWMGPYRIERKRPKPAEEEK